jgi:prefoldin subunit 5
LGGTGYMTMNTAMADLDKKVEVITVKAQSTNEKLTAVQQQLARIEEKLDARSSRK